MENWGEKESRFFSSKNKTKKQQKNGNRVIVAIFLTASKMKTSEKINRIFKITNGNRVGWLG